MSSPSASSLPPLCPDPVLAEFIEREMGRCIRSGPAAGIRFRLPHPYTVPCPEKNLQALFYWDTWFTNLALFRMGRTDLALANTDNLLWMLETFGFVPGNNTFWGLTTTQPPFLALMVRDVFAATGNREWLARARNLLISEHTFWQEHRGTPCGLNRYFHSFPADDWRDFWEWSRARIALPDGFSGDDAREAVPHLRAVGESGWDFTPRWNLRAADYCPVELNSLLHAHEMFLAESAEWVGATDAAHWRGLANSRRDLLNKLCWDERAGCFLDYNFRTGGREALLNASAFFPLWLGVASREQAARTRECLLPVLETDHGIVTCEPSDRPGTFQWAHPNLWPPLQLPAIAALDACGFTADADRISKKFTTLIERNFASTGALWEKYHAVDGTSSAAGEYLPPKMMGWTAGVYLWCCHSQSCSTAS